MHRWLSVPAACAAVALAAPLLMPAGQPAAAQDVLVAFAHVPEPGAATAPNAAVVERYLGDPRQLSKWARVADAVAREIAVPVASGPLALAAAHGGTGGPALGLADIAAINRRVNAMPYRADSENWGVGDLWATPAEFARRGGDCEDYAIAKYVALRRAGVPASALRIEVGYDRGRDDYHAALTVQLDGRAWLLDMDVDQPIARESHRNLVTIYTINETGLWVRG